MRGALLLVPVLAEDRLPWRHLDTIGLLHEGTELEEFVELDAGGDAVHLEERRGFLEGDTAAAIADADDRAIDPVSTPLHRRHGVGRRDAEIVAVLHVDVA